MEKPLSVSAYLRTQQFTALSQPHVQRAREVATQVEDPGSAGGDTITRSERLRLHGALTHLTPENPAERQRFQALRDTLLRSPDDGANIIRVNAKGVNRERAPASDFLKGEPRERLLADATRRLGRAPEAHEVDRVLTDEQRRRDIPLAVTVDGRPVEAAPLRWNDTLPRADATTRPRDAGPNTYQLIPNASIEGRERVPVQANPLYDRMRETVQRAFPGARIDSPRDLLPYIRSITPQPHDGYARPIEGDGLRAVLERGAILRTQQPVAGQRFAGDGAWEISPVLALRGNGSDAGVGNPWGIGSIDIALQTPAGYRRP